MERRSAAVPQGPFHITPVFAAKAQGPTVEDVDGNRFLDFANGIGVTNTGHNHPEVVAAVKEQTDQYIHTSFNVMPYEPYVEVAERLNQLAPGDFPKKTFLVNSGAEAVENAVKFARAFTKRQGIICFDHAYHGRTYMAMTMTAKTKPYKHGFAPFNPEVYRAPLPYNYRWPGQQGKGDEPTVVAEAFRAFIDVVEGQVGPDQVAAVVIEPVVGEGGFIPVPLQFMKKLDHYCKEHGILLILDEIQTGFGRTAKMFAANHYGLEPDMLILAKGLAGGMPLSAVVGRADVLEGTPVGGAGGTYSGNPVACAAALAALDHYENPETFAHARVLGDVMIKTLNEWFEQYPIIGDHRGLGPMRAIELVTDRESKTPNKDAVGAILKHSYENGVICIGAGTYGNVLRFLIPLTATVKELEEGLSIVEEGIRRLCPVPADV